MARTLGKYGSAFAGLMASTILVPAAASAQEAAPADAVTPTAYTDGDIVVTAQKRSESIQRVPISMQALSPVTLEQRQVKTFDDYAKLLPSVSFQSFGPGQSQLFFRGIASGGDGLAGGALPTSGVYLDEIPVTTIGALLDVHAYDIARVEALSGPQGTLYGASSLSGTLRIITNKPDASKFEAGVDVQGNKFGKGGYGGVAESFVNVPLTDMVAVRAMGYYQRGGGFIDNTPASRTYTLSDADPTTNLTVNNSKYVKKNFNTSDDFGGRVALGIDLDDNWTVTPTVIAQKLKTKGTFLFDPRAGDLEVHDFTPDHTSDKWYQAALTIEGKVSDFDITYSGGYLQRSLDITQDYSYYTVYYDNVSYYTYFPTASGGFLDPTQGYHNHQAISKQTHELRLTSPATEPFRFTAGLFMQRQANHNTADYIIPGLGAIPNSLAVYKDDIFYTDTHIVARDYAAFAQATYEITPTVSITGGIRGFKYRNTLGGFSGFQSNATAPGCTIPIMPGKCITIDKQAKKSGETHKLTLTWQATPDKMLYATYSTGFRPGGNNRRPGINPYDPDTIDNFELGFKTSWFDRVLRFNAAAYYEKWNKLQYALSPVGSAGVTNVYNAGDARVYGIEADFAIVPGNGVSLTGSAAYNDAKLTTNFCQIGATGNSDCSTGVFAAPKGTRLPIQPKFKGSLTARYDFEFGDWKPWFQASVNHQSSARSYLGVVEGSLLGDTPGFATVDFSIGTKKDSWSVELFIQNILDDRGELSRNTVCAPVYCGPFYRVYPIKPQLFGIKLSQRY